MKSNFIKTMLVLMIGFFAFFSTVNAQGIVGVKTYSYSGLANSKDQVIKETFDGLIQQFKCNKIDSLVIGIAVQNETDIDSLDFYPADFIGITPVKGTIVHYTVTLNVAASATGKQVLLTADAGIGSSAWRGYEGFYILWRPAAAGNDATDPNYVKVVITFYGS